MGWAAAANPVARDAKAGVIRPRQKARPPVSENEDKFQHAWQTMTERVHGIQVPREIIENFPHLMMDMAQQ